MVVNRKNAFRLVGTNLIKQVSPLSVLTCKIPPSHHIMTMPHTLV